MHYSQRVFFSNENDTLPEDEIDKLFDKLEQIEPPPFLIARILTSVSRLSQAEQSAPWDELDGMIVRNDKRPPS